MRVLSKKMEQLEDEVKEMSEKKMLKLIEEYKENELLLDRLHDIQNKFGYLPEEELVELAAEKEIPKAHLYGIVSFYSRFYTEPVGKYKVRICKSISCGMNSSKKILKVISESLGINPGETTEDKLFTLEAVECLGHCGEGPVITVNDKVYGEITEAKALEILEEYIERGEKHERRKIS